jgi:protein SDA1
MAAPTSATDSGIISLRDLIDFISHVADCYPEITKDFPHQLIAILTLHHPILESELREKIVGSLVLLRKKDIIDSTTYGSHLHSETLHTDPLPSLLQTFFPILTSTPSKTLRTLLFNKILSDLRNANSKSANHKLNRTIQTVLYNLLTSDRTSPKGLWAVKVSRELWRRQIWTDAKTVEIMKEAALAENERVIVGGVRFFLGGDKEREEFEDDTSDDDGIDMSKLRHQAGINKKSRKASKALDKAASAVKRKEKKKHQPHPLNFSALHLLHDPQGLAETLFAKHLQNTKSRLNLEQKLLALQLISRLIGLHKLTVLSFYSYFLKYLTPRQPSVTTFLACLAQSAHNLVPPDVLEPLIQKIANEFVSEAAAAEVASSGLNAIREICVRQPLAMNDTLLQDLVMYKKSKDKGVMMAAKGLLGLYREVGAEMLKKRDRGKEAAVGLRSGQQKQQMYGDMPAGEIEGLDLLEKWKKEERKRRRLDKGLSADGSDDEEEDEEDDWGAWDVEDDESDDSGGWINVESDKEIEISDDENEGQSEKKRVKLDNVADNKENDAPSCSEAKQSNLATTRILTPADFVKLQELRAQAAINSQLPKKGHKAHHASTPSAAATNAHRHMDDPVTAAEIEGLAALSKGRATREEKLAAQEEWKTDRTEHKSRAAKKQERKQQEGKSTTNKEKARKKNFLMTLGKAKQKGKRSLVETRKVLRAHAERGKRGGKRGNR